MRFYLIILFALCIFDEVSALQSAVPYQIVAFFYAYRINIDAFGVVESLIASNIRGSIVDGSCTLDEFIEFTRKPRKNCIPFPKELRGDDLTPDLLATVQKIESPKYFTRHEFEASILLPRNFTMKSGSPPSFAFQIQVINGYTTVTFEFLACKKGFNQSSSDTQPNFVNLKAAIRGILDAGQVDSGSKNHHQLNQSLQVHGITSVIKTVIAVDSTTCTELDTALTIRGSNSPEIDARAASNKVVSSTESLPDDPITKRHTAVISSLEQWLVDLDTHC